MSEELDLLRSIDETLKALLVLSRSKRSAASAPAAVVADDADLDGPHGDEVLKAKMPKDWTGIDYKGARMSECPSELLDIIASRCDYFAQQNDERDEKDGKGRPKSYWDKLTAKRARGWAARKRAGWKAPEAASVQPSSDEISW